jgi:rhamnogalacturonyl hydrolase YesR
MFIYSLAKGINEGWIDKRYMTVAREGWKGLKTKINPEGDIEGICKATDISTSLFYYYKRPTPVNDIHGIGVVFAAGVEMMKLMKR